MKAYTLLKSKQSKEETGMDYIKGNTIIEPAKCFTRGRNIKAYYKKMGKSSVKNDTEKERRKKHDGV